MVERPLPSLSSPTLLLKHLLLLLVCALALSILGGGWLHFELQSEAEHRLQRRHSAVLGLLTLTIEEGFTGPWERIMELTASAGVVGDESPYARRRLIESIVRYNDDVLSLGLLDGTAAEYQTAVAPELQVALLDPTTGARDAALLAGQDDAIIEAALRSNNIHFGRVTTLPGRTPRILTAAIPSPLPALERGVLVARFSADRLLERCTRVATAEQLDLTLVNTAGHLIYRSSGTGRIRGTLAGDETPLAFVASVGARHPMQLLDYQAPAGSSHAGERMRGVASSLPDLGWFVVLSEPESSALQGLMVARKLILAWAAASLIVATVVAIWLSAWITRPLQLARDAVRKLAEGDHSARVPVVSRDEIGALCVAVNRLAQSFKAQQADILRDVLREKSKTEAIVRNMADGLLVVDREGCVGLVNSQFERWFGVPAITAVGRPRNDVIAHESLSRHLDAAAEIPPRRVCSSNLDLDLGGDRPQQTLQARSVRVFDSRRDAVGIVTVLRDVTRERKIEQMKSDLVSTVSHELRTPLTSIQGFSEILLEEELSDEEISEFAQIISSEARRLGSLINDFLDLSRIESGEIEIRQADLNLSAILASSAVIVEQQAATRGIEVHGPRKEGEDIYLIGDRDKLEQVFVNLISNAVKYSRDNSVVDIGIRSDDAEVMVEVRDEGHGIPPEYLPRIFDRFFRGDMSSTSETGGTGLGLTIVREIVERHGGSVVARSVVGMGSSFVVTLPRFGARSSAKNNNRSASHPRR